MLKWYDFQELEYSLGALPTLGRKLKIATDLRQTENKKIPRDLKLDIFLRRLILKKKILARRFEWSKNELKNLFSEKTKLENNLIILEDKIRLLEKENENFKNELRELKSTSFTEGDLLI